MGFLGVLTLVFIVLKLIEVIDWSWWLVISPLYVWVAFFLLLLMLSVINGVLIEMSKRK